jgi:hypothetical protein
MNNRADDLIRMFEFGKTFGQPPHRTPRRDRRYIVKEKKEERLDPVEVLMQMRRSVDDWNKVVGDLGKADKKEEKKEDKSWWNSLTGIQKFTVVLAVTPFLSLLEMLPIILILRLFLK